MYQAITGSVTVLTTGANYLFGPSPNGIPDAAFVVGEAPDIIATRPVVPNQPRSICELPPDASKIIAFEDTYETTNIDWDYDDRFWPATLWPLPTPAATRPPLTMTAHRAR